MEGNRSPVEAISAVTLVTTDMERSLDFYLALGFPVRHGGRGCDFTSLVAGDGFLNVQLVERWEPPSVVWGRVIIWVGDVDEMYERVRSAGGHPEAPPSDAPWGERYFHVRDPDGHELSFARLLPG
jgi:catechol 2,3-dioxygenase-like lactoylglutathione lyase family enzyme